MSKTLADHAKAYRARRTAKLERLEQGHRDILTTLADNDKPLAVKLRAIATNALESK